MKKILLLIADMLHNAEQKQSYVRNEGILKLSY